MDDAHQKLEARFQSICDRIRGPVPIDLKSVTQNTLQGGAREDQGSSGDFPGTYTDIVKAILIF